MSAKIKCPACFHHVPANDFCPRCTRLNISEEALDSLYQELGAAKPEPDTRGDYTLQGRWGDWGYLLLAAILGVVGIKLGLDFSERFLGAFEQLQKGVFSWQTFLFGAGSFALLYLAAALALNKTWVFINKEILGVKRGPVPLPLADSYILPAKQIKRIDLFRSLDNEDSSETCEIMVVDENGESFDIYTFNDLAEAVGWYKTIKDLFDLKDVQQSSVVKRRVRTVHPQADTISLIYRIVLPGSFVLNLPAILLAQEWRFDSGYWLTFSLFTLAVFLVMNFHHRKHLNVWDSQPLEADEEQVGPIFYGVITIIYCFMLTPVAMWIYSWVL